MCCTESFCISGLEKILGNNIAVFYCRKNKNMKSDKYHIFRNSDKVHLY